MSYKLVFFERNISIDTLIAKRQFLTREGVSNRNDLRCEGCTQESIDEARRT